MSLLEEPVRPAPPHPRVARTPRPTPPFALSVAPPGDQSLEAPAHLHLLDVHLDGAAATYAVETIGGTTARGRSPVRSFSFLPAGAARRVVTCRSGPALRALFEPGMLAMAGLGVEAATLVPILHAHDVPLLGAARIACASLSEEERADADAGGGEARGGVALVGTLVLRLCQILRQRAVPSRARAQPRDVQRVLEHIEANIGERLTLAELAAVAGASQFHLARKFRSALGVSLHDYVMSRRVARAEAMIAEGSASLAEIAYASGFGSQSHMTTTFRKRLNCTPGALRRG